MARGEQERAASPMQHLQQREPLLGRLLGSHLHAGAVTGAVAEAGVSRVQDSQTAQRLHVRGLQ